LPQVTTTLSALVFAAHVAVAASPVFQPHTVDKKTYSETNTAIAWLQDGTYVHAQLAVSNLSLRGGRGACRILMVRPGSPPWTGEVMVDRDEWSAGLKPAPNLKIGPCKATANGQGTTFDIQVEGTSVSIALSAPAQSHVPPGYPLKMGDAFYESDVLVPFAPVQVVLEPEHGDPQVLDGFGYADHSRSTTLPKDLLKGWVRFRGFSPKCSTILSVRLPPGKDEGPYAYWWRQGSAQPEALGAPSITMPGENFEQTPVDLVIHTDKRDFKITGKSLLYRDAPLESHGVLGRMVGAFVGHVTTKTYAAVLHDEGACGDISGVLELEWAGD
jgi:hypothetical protein